MNRIRVAIPVQDKRGLEDEIFEHFGHAPYFLLVDVENNEITTIEIVENPYASQHGPGLVPQFLKEKDVNILICMGIGRRALDFFNRLGIEVITGAMGKVEEILNEYLKGSLASREYTPARKWGDL